MYSRVNETAARERPPDVLHEQIEAERPGLESGESVVHIEACSLFVQGVNDHEANADALGDPGRDAQGVEQKVGAQSPALIGPVDR